MFKRTLTRKIRVVNIHGLHARPCLAIVNAVRGLDAKVQIHKDDQVVDADSVLQLMTLVATQGTELTISAQGPEAEHALDELEGLFARSFDLPGD
jgi:phosphotransferase system HPr (HPr) family protein